MGEYKTFYYPQQRGIPAHRMCSAGQRRAAAEAWNLLVQGGEKGEDATLKRAARAERDLRFGADTSKHNLISFVVFTAFCNERLGEYVAADGSYTLELSNGHRISSNILVDAGLGKNIF